MGLTDKYRSSVSRAPRCYGKDYDPDDQECREECPWRSDCYDEIFLNEASKKPSRSSSPLSRESYSNSRRSSTSGKPSKTSSRTPSRMPMEVDDGDVLPYPGEPWYSRLWWNSVSGALSAMGWETHSFFRYFRFPPQPEEKVDVKCCNKEDN